MFNFLIALAHRSKAVPKASDAQGRRAEPLPHAYLARPAFSALEVLPPYRGGILQCLAYNFQDYFWQFFYIVLTKSRQAPTALASRLTIFTPWFTEWIEVETLCGGGSVCGAWKFTAKTGKY